MRITRTSQGYQLSKLVNGHLISKHYIGYKLKESKKRFNIMLQEIKQ